jgi:hypothetical protein
MLAAKAPINLKGHKRAPECTIELKKSSQGSRVNITYEFEKAHVGAPCCCLAPLLPAALRKLLNGNIRPMWKDQMMERGYPDLAQQAATRMQAACKGFGVRRGEARRQLQTLNKTEDEEDDGTADDNPSVATRPNRGGAVRFAAESSDDDTFKKFSRNQKEAIYGPGESQKPKPAHSQTMASRPTRG